MWSFSVHTEYFPSDGAIWYFVGWSRYNFKSSILHWSASPFEKIIFKLPFFVMAPWCYTTHWSLCINLLADILGEQDELTSARSNTGSNKTPTPLTTPTTSLIPLSTKNLFTIFIKVLMETMQTQVWDREELKPQERPLKAKTSNTYFRKSHIDYYHFYQ